MGTVAEYLEAVGMEKGRQEGEQQTAINLLKEGFDTPLIAKVTNLSSDVIEQLKGQLK